MDFGQALYALKDGARVMRAGWNGKGMWLVLVPGSRVQLTPGTPYDKALGSGGYGQTHVTIDAHIDMLTAKGTMQPGWLASQADMLADDWELVSS